MADQDIALYERRIARLEEEAAAANAQAETVAINYEQAARAMEERYSALSEEHEKLAATKEQLQLESRRLTEDLTQARSQCHSLQAQLVKKDTSLEEKSVQIESLHSEKRALDKQLEHRQEEINEAERRLKATQEQVLSLTARNTKLDAEVHEAKASQRRTELEKLQLQQINENLERNSKWLEENLTHVGDALKAERDKGSKQVMELEGKAQEAAMKVQSLERMEAHLRSKLEQQTKAAEDAQTALKIERDEAVAKEQQFEKELATAQKLAALYKENSDKRSAEAAELGNVVRDLRKHVEEITGAHKAATQKLQEAVTAAEKRLEEEQTKCQRMLDAAASGHFSTSQPANEGSVAQASPGEGMLSPQSSIAKMSKTEIYVKYAEAATKWKEERLRNRQNEIVLEGLCAEMERKAVLVKEQQAEYERVQAAYGQMTITLENFKAEKKHAEAIQLDLKAQIRRDAKKHSLLEQQIKDLGRQVAVLLNEQQRKAIGQLSSRSPLALPSPGGSSNSGQLTGELAVSEHLVAFANIQELQEQNQKQLAVIRELTQQQEASAAEARAELEAEKEAIRQKNEEIVESYRKQRAEQEELVQQIVRQRDMFRKLLQDAANNPSRAAAAAADLQLIAAADAQMANGSARTAPSEPNYQQLYADLEKEVEGIRQETSEHLRQLREEGSKAKEDAAAARADCARALADAAFERQRAERQTEYLEEQHLQMQAISDHSAKYQEMMISLQERLSSALSDSQAAQQNITALQQKITNLEVDKKLATSAEQRLAAQVSQLSADKHTREAELKTERESLARLEEQYASERARLTDELQKAQRAEADAVRDLGEAQKRARDAAAARDVIREQADERAAKLEEEVRKARDAESEALQKAATAQGKAEVLQKALQKAEERAATLEFQVNSRTSQGGEASTAGPSTGDGREAQLVNEVKMLKEELGAAYEKAAQATSHVSQFQALAESSDEALKAMQNDHAAYKAEADKHIAAAVKEAGNLKERLDAAKQDNLGLQQKVQQLETAVAGVQKASQELESKMKIEIERQGKLLQSKNDLINRLERDVEFWRQKFNSAEERAQREVVDHAATIKQLQTADKAKTILDSTINDHIHKKSVAEAKEAAAVSELKTKTAEMNAAIEAANRKREKAEQQNKLLLEQLEKISQQLPTDGDNEMVGVLSHLRHQAQVLEEEKQLARHEADRLRSEISTLKRTIDSLRTQMISEDERQQRSTREEALFEERKRHQADLNMVRESNSSLRSQNAELDKQVRILRGKLQEMEVARRPRELEITRLKADIENLGEELKLRIGEAEHWEKRVNQLQEKYGKVDLEEYKRVENKLKDLQQSSKDTVPRGDLVKAETRAKEAEAVLRNHQRAQSSLQQQLGAAQRSLQDEAARCTAAKEANDGSEKEIQRLRSELAQLTDAKEAVDVKMGRTERVTARHMSICNPTKLRHEEWKSKRIAEQGMAEVGHQFVAAFEADSTPAALKARMQALLERITELENLLKIASETTDKQVEKWEKERTASAQKLGQAERKVRELEDLRKSATVGLSSGGAADDAVHPQAGAGDSGKPQADKDMQEAEDLVEPPAEKPRAEAQAPVAQLTTQSATEGAGKASDPDLAPVAPATASSPGDLTSKPQPSLPVSMPAKGSQEPTQQEDVTGEAQVPAFTAAPAPLVTIEALPAAQPQTGLPLLPLVPPVSGPPPLTSPPLSQAPVASQPTTEVTEPAAELEQPAQMPSSEILIQVDPQKPAEGEPAKPPSSSLNPSAPAFSSMLPDTLRQQLLQQQAEVGAKQAVGQPLDTEQVKQPSKTPAQLAGEAASKRARTAEPDAPSPQPPSKRTRNEQEPPAAIGPSAELATIAEQAATGTPAAEAVQEERELVEEEEDSRWPLDEMLQEEEEDEHEDEEAGEVPRQLAASRPPATNRNAPFEAKQVVEKKAHHDAAELPPTSEGPQTRAATAAAAQEAEGQAEMQQEEEEKGAQGDTEEKPRRRNKPSPVVWKDRTQPKESPSLQQQQQQELNSPPQGRGAGLTGARGRGGRGKKGTGGRKSAP